MARCERKRSLQVHHISRYGNSIPSNARVLCDNCHQATQSYGTDRDMRRKYYEFSDTQKREIKASRGNRCECTSNRGCH
jgi:hypothetical protein